MIKAVMFDLDDTLLRTVEAKFDHHKAVALEHFGITLTDDELRQHWGKPLSVLVGELYRHADTVENLIAINRAQDHRFPKGVFVDAADALRRLLDNDVMVGVVTSTMTEFAHRDLIRHGLPVDELFIVQGEDLHHAHKPDPAVFDPALTLLGRCDIDRTDTAYVGDSLIDLAAARDAELRFVAVTTGLASRADMQRAGAADVCDNLTEVVDLFLSPSNQERR